MPTCEDAASARIACEQAGLSCKQVGRKAAAVDIPPFTPQQGVRIETDPKAASAAPGPAAGDDESAISRLTQQLQVHAASNFLSHRMLPMMPSLTSSRCCEILSKGILTYFILAVWHRPLAVKLLNWRATAIVHMLSLAAA